MRIEFHLTTLGKSKGSGKSQNEAMDSISPRILSTFKRPRAMPMAKWNPQMDGDRRIPRLKNIFLSCPTCSAGKETNSTSTISLSPPISVTVTIPHWSLSPPLKSSSTYIIHSHSTQRWHLNLPEGCLEYRILPFQQLPIKEGISYHWTPMRSSPRHWFHRESHILEQWYSSFG